MATYVSPIGKLVGFTALHEPKDYLEDGKFKYICKLLLTDKEALAFASEIDALQKAALLEANAEAGKKKYQPAPPPYSTVVDDDGNTVPDELLFKFSVPATWKSGDSRAPSFHDIDGKRMEKAPKIGAGSQVRIRFSAYAWEANGKVGLRLEPRAVQVRELVEFHGTGEEEGFDSLLPELNPNAEPPF